MKRTRTMKALMAGTIALLASAVASFTAAMRHYPYWRWILLAIMQASTGIAAWAQYDREKAADRGRKDEPEKNEDPWF